MHVRHYTQNEEMSGSESGVGDSENQSVDRDHKTLVNISLWCNSSLSLTSIYT